MQVAGGHELPASFPGGQLGGSVLSFCPTGPEEGTQVVRLSGRHSFTQVSRFISCDET